MESLRSGWASEQVPEVPDDMSLRVRKMSEIGQMAAGLAHDVNNMMQVVLGNVELGMDEVPEKLRPYQQGIRKAALQTADLAKRMLSLSRGEEKGGRTSVSIGVLLNNLVGLCRRTFNSEIDIVLDVREEIGTEANEGELTQAFLNLLLNARDAIEAGCPATPRIVVRLDVAENRQVGRPGRSGTSAYARVVIEDNGIGMDDDTIERIFQPYFTTKDPDRGTGLGLGTVQEITARYGGYVECDSTWGKGTTFAVCLPATGRAPTPVRADARPLPRGSEAVMIVEDDELVRISLSRLLKRQGYSVESAQNGEEALQMLRSNPSRTDLILLDLMLPRLSGWDFLKRLPDVSTQAKIVVITGRQVEKEELGPVSSLLRKPVDLRDLSCAVRQALDEGGRRP